MVSQVGAEKIATTAAAECQCGEGRNLAKQPQQRMEVAAMLTDTHMSNLVKKTCLGAFMGFALAMAVALSAVV